MTDWTFPIRELHEEVKTILAQTANTGVVVEHVFGEKGRAAHGKAARYVWVPSRSRERKDTPSRQVDELRTLFSMREHVEIDCWGITYDAAWALRQNLLVALHEAAQVDIAFESAEWVRPSESWNQSGELYRIEISLGVPVPDGYVNLETLILPDQSLVTPEAYEANLYVSPDVEHDGDSFITVTTADPVP